MPEEKDRLPVRSWVAPDRAGLGAIVGLLRDGRPRSRSELAAMSGLSRAAVNSRLDALVAARLLVADEAVSTGGRPAARFRLGTESGLVLSALLGATHADIGITDLSAQVLAENPVELDIARGPEPVLESVLRVWREQLQLLSRSVEDVRGVGLGVPGPVEFAAGRPVKPPIMPGWDGFDVRRFFSDIPAPVLVDNDVNVMAIGEHAMHWPAERELLLVKVGTGIGSGIISGGHILRGAQGAAGDLGHVHVEGLTNVCRCGNVGCLEATAGGGALVSRLHEVGLDVSNTRDVVRLVRAGNPVAGAAVREAGRLLGAVLSTCVSLMNPAVLVIAGDLALAEDQLFAGVREVVYRRSLPLATRHLQIVASRLGDRAGIVGAAVMVIDRILDPTYIDETVGRLLAG